MKSMLKILTRYVFSAAGIALVLLMLNLAIFVFWIVQSSEYAFDGFTVSKVANALEKENEAYHLTDFGKEALDKRYQWAMLLNESGEVVWSERLPDDVPHEYTVSEVASFTRWYLKDYPVYVWKRSDGLFVLGGAKDSAWKHGFEFPSALMEKTITWLPVILILNVIAAFLLALILGMRLFHSIQPLVRGIEDLAQKKPVKISTGGILGDMADKLNRASDQLQQQEAALQRRDTARTTWIAGISHDIRTPLTMMMGYASQLEDNPNLSSEERQQAGVIRRQSERIKKLINNLNLASKLEYEMQPLRLEKVDPAELIRNLVADFLNNGLDTRYSINFSMEEEVQKNFIQADKELLGRAVSNLIENSIQHNPGGCVINIDSKIDADHFLIIVSDNGKGLPTDVLNRQGAFDVFSFIPTHGLGLTIVHQVLKAHHGEVVMDSLLHKGSQITLQLPIE